MNQHLNPMDTQHTSTEGRSLGSSLEFRVARRGARPLVFTGTQLAMAMSFTPELPYWYEINIYRTNDERFVLVVRLFFQAEDRKDTMDAWMFETLSEVFDAIERYDAGQDVHADLDGFHAGMTPVELAAHALDLRARVEAARHHFAGLAGELFAEIEAVPELT